MLGASLSSRSIKQTLINTIILKCLIKQGVIEQLVQMTIRGIH